jgi:UDP-N-acetylglucosamine--N-acetylmuramyl-(pentapeptide) pyrophosphoryl-undecaprenol N-acetylglucosamine transferase
MMGALSGGPILVMAGGTGGHVFPALAVARVLRERGVAVVWLGTPGGMESRLVPAQGFPIEWVKVAGIRGDCCVRSCRRGGYCGASRRGPCSAPADS